MSDKIDYEKFAIKMHKNVSKVIDQFNNEKLPANMAFYVCVCAIVSVLNSVDCSKKEKKDKLETIIVLLKETFEMKNN